MDEKVKMESKLSSAAAFVEGGVQDACDDACSICLEAFCDNDPSTVCIRRGENSGFDMIVIESLICFLGVDVGVLSCR